MFRPLATLVAAAALASPVYAVSDFDRHDGHRHHHRSDDHKGLVDRYERWAGSEKNARELVSGLRNDERIDLSKNGATASFTPATGKMGWGNVDHALALAKASLAEHGIRNPTPDQIKAALNGGTITASSGKRVQMTGVLQMRARGMGWGEIAHRLGVKHGDAKQARHGHKHGHKHAKHGHERHAHKHAHGKPHHAHADVHRTNFERPQRPEKAEKVERPNKPERPQRPERPERHHHRR